MKHQIFVLPEKKYYLLSLLILGLNISYCQKQEFEQEWHILLKKYKQQDQYESHAQYTMYAGHHSKEIISNSESIVIKKGKQIYQKIEGIETIVNEQHMIYVDKDEKLILFDRALKHFENKIIPEDIGKNMNLISEIKLVSQSGFIKNYAVQLTNQEISRLDLSINTKTSVLLELIIYYESEYEYTDAYNQDKKVKPRLKIRFDTKDGIDSKFYTITENPYLAFKNDKPSIKPAYKSFELIDNRIKLKK